MVELRFGLPAQGLAHLALFGQLAARDDERGLLLPELEHERRDHHQGQEQDGRHALQRSQARVASVLRRGEDCELAGELGCGRALGRVLTEPALEVGPQVSELSLLRKARGIGGSRAQHGHDVRRVHRLCQIGVERVAQYQRERVNIGCAADRSRRFAEHGCGSLGRGVLDREAYRILSALGGDAEVEEHGQTTRKARDLSHEDVLGLDVVVLNAHGVHGCEPMRNAGEQKPRVRTAHGRSRVVVPENAVECLAAVPGHRKPEAALVPAVLLELHDRGVGDARDELELPERRLLLLLRCGRTVQDLEGNLVVADLPIGSAVHRSEAARADVLLDHVAHAHEAADLEHHLDV